MNTNIKLTLNRPVKLNEFQELVSDFRKRFGIPEKGFNYSNTEEYKNWIKEAIRKADHIKDSFLFIAKRCRNLTSNNEPISLTVLACYFFFNSIPIKENDEKEIIFSINPSGILGNFDIIFTVPLIFNLNDFLLTVNKNKPKVEEIIKDVQNVIKSIENSDEGGENQKIDMRLDLLETTPANGSDIIDRVHRLIGYLVEFGRISLREHLRNMKAEDFIIEKYEDKNKPISHTVQQMGMFLMNRGLYPISEEYWRQIENEILLFNKINNRNINRGIALGNQGVSQIAQGKVVEGLFNLYKAYKNDEDSLKHLSNIIINPENDLSKSILFTQFESRQVSKLFKTIIQKHIKVFTKAISENDLKIFILNISPDKKILLFITLYRFAFSCDLNKELSNPINRGEIIRSLSELTLWYEDELKRKDKKWTGKTLGIILNNKLKTNLDPTHHEFTYAKDLDELENKINEATKQKEKLSITNARITTCFRNFTGHSYSTKNHSIYKMVDEIFARILSLIIFSYDEGWI